MSPFTADDAPVEKILSIETYSALLYFRVYERTRSLCKLATACVQPEMRHNRVDLGRGDRVEMFGK